VEKRKYTKKVVETYEHLPPPRSNLYINSKIAKELMVFANNNRYIMRILECGAVELVRYDYSANKWVVLCFDGIVEDKLT